MSSQTDVMKRKLMEGVLSGLPGFAAPIGAAVLDVLMRFAEEEVPQTKKAWTEPYANRFQKRRGFDGKYRHENNLGTPRK